MIQEWRKRNSHSLLDHQRAIARVHKIHVATMKTIFDLQPNSQTSTGTEGPGSPPTSCTHNGHVF